MQGISVALIDSYDGATTDSSGNFSFTTSEKGEQILKATATGYKPFEEKINYINANRFKHSTERRNYRIKSGCHDHSFGEKICLSRIFYKS